MTRNMFDGVLDNGDPPNSYLVLTKTDEESENEGLFHAREIQYAPECRFSCPCETSNGRISPVKV